MAPKAYSYIRFSTPDQERGDSLRRQTELSKAYAERHELELDTTLSLRDLGISAFNGAHRGKGKLGEFLKLVDQGKIPVGSVLLVESFDRLSREEITEALEQFLTLIRKGIQIVTLSDQRLYTKETINSDMGQLIISITIMSRAHEESLIKSQRVRAAWDKKRAKIAKQKLTAQCPEWLCLPPHKREYEVIPDRAEIIREIFQFKLQGHGSRSISRILNETDKFWNPGGWKKSYVEKILRYQSVYGAYQPYTRQRHKRVPLGDPIPGYYPEIVSEDVFLRVQDIFHKNHRKGGQNGAVNNLFTHLVKCGYCGAAMHHYGGGKYHYLVCENAYHRQGCDYLSVHYLEIEQIILKYCKGLDPSSLLISNDDTQNTIRLLEEQLTAVKIKLEKIENRADNLVDELSDTPRYKKLVRELLIKKLEQTLEEQETLQLQQVHIQQELHQSIRNGKDISEHLNSINQLYEHMNSLDSTEKREPSSSFENGTTTVNTED